MLGLAIFTLVCLGLAGGLVDIPPRIAVPDSNHWSMPAYCAVEIEGNTIKPIGKDYLKKMTPMQVTVLTRHGATAPKHGYYCWENNNEMWNCSMTDVSYTDLRRDESTISAQPLRRVFHKIYERNGNEVKGTCGAGHLMTEGEMQAMANGLNLRKMYVGKDNINLWETSDIRRITDKNFFRLRVDDTPAATMTATALFNSFFLEADAYKGRAFNLPIVTRDFQSDWMHPNEKLCPRMEQARLVMQKSSEFWNLNSSLGPLTAQLKQALGIGFQWEHAIDCLMTAKCSKQLFPKAMEEGMFNSAIESSEKLAQVRYTFNHSYYSKLAVRNMLIEIYEGMLAAMTHEPGHKTFQLYSGGGDMLMAFLAAFEGNVWDGKLPPYGAMVAIELFQLQIPSPTHPAGWMHAFRMLYNGKPVTVPGCSEELCDVDVFKKFVESLAHTLGSCGLSEAELVEVRKDAQGATCSGLKQDIQAGTVAAAASQNSGATSGGNGKGGGGGDADTKNVADDGSTAAGLSGVGTVAAGAGDSASGGMSTGVVVIIAIFSALLASIATVQIQRNANPYLRVPSAGPMGAPQQQQQQQQQQRQSMHIQGNNPMRQMQSYHNSPGEFGGNNQL
jgi:hypothetical protein